MDEVKPPTREDLVITLHVALWMGQIGEDQQREEPESEGAKALKDSANMFAAFVTATIEAEDRKQATEVR